MSALPIINSCDDCGACCRTTPIPPFEPGEEYQKDVSEDLLQPIRDRIAADQHFDLLSCVWFDEGSRRCKHYELRPDACRKFEINTDLCRLARWDLGVDV